MPEPSLEESFLRFRERGDPAALAQVFDAVAPELMRLALHLAPSLTEAEDLVQATLVAAIEGRGRFERERPLLPWLVGILARQACLARRRARHTPDPERLREPHVADPARATEEREFSALFTRTLEGLPALYRDVLRRHLVEGERAVEIAHDLGRAPGTVRMQLARGLEMLRARLPEGLTAGVAWTALAGRGETAVREAVLRVAAHACTPAAGSVGTLPLLIGGSTMMGKTAALAGSLLAVGLAALTWSLTFRPGAESTAAAPSASATDPALDGLPPRSAGPRTDAAGLDRQRVAEVAVASRSPMGATRLSGTVLVPGGADVSEVEVAAFPLARFTDGPVHASRTTTCGEDGRFELELEEGGEQVLLAVGPDLRPARLDAVAVEGRGSDAGALQLDEGGAIAGRLMLPVEVTVAGIAIRAALDGAAVDRYAWHALTVREGIPHRQAIETQVGDGGGFRLAGLTTGDHYTVSHGLPEGVHIGLTQCSRPAVVPEPDLVLGSDMWLLDLTVLDDLPSGAEPWAVFQQLHSRSSGPLRNGRFLALLGMDVTAGWVADRSRPTLWAAIDLSGAEPGAVLERMVHLEDHSPELGTVLVEAVGEHRPSGAVTVETTHLDPVPEGMGPGGFLGPHRFERAELDGGVVTVRALPPGRYRLRIKPEGVHPVQSPGMAQAVTLETEARAGETTFERVPFPAGGRVRLEVDPQCSPPTPIFARVTDAAGERVQVHLHQRLEFEDGPRLGSGFIDPRSPAFVQPPLAPGRYTVRLSAPGGWTSPTETFTVVAGEWTTVRVGPRQ